MATTRLVQHIERHCLRKTFARARLPFDGEARQDTRTTIRKKPRKATPPIPFMGMGRMVSSYDRLFDVETEESIIEYGPYIPTLVRKLEAGDFSQVSTSGAFTVPDAFHTTTRIPKKKQGLTPLSLSGSKQLNRGRRPWAKTARLAAEPAHAQRMVLPGGWPGARSGFAGAARQRCR